MFAQVFNNCVLGFAIGHAANSGLLNQIRDHGSIDEKEFAGLIAAPAETVIEICGTLEGHGVVNREGSRVVPGPIFEQAFRYSGYFEWLLLGYGGLLAAPDAIRGVARFDTRNGAAVATGSARIGAFDVDPILFPYVSSRAGRSVVDLGCGSGQRLMALAAADDSITAIGIDVDPGAVSLGQQLVAERGLQDRVSIRCADVTRLEKADWLGSQKDLVMMSFMGHDMWPYDKAVQVFRRFRECFEDCGCFVMSDTVRPVQTGPGDPIFTNGFHLTHALMGKYIPRMEEWEVLFDATGWSLRSREPLGVPNTYMFELAPSPAPQDA